MTVEWKPNYPYWEAVTIEQSGLHQVIDYYLHKSPEERVLVVTRNFQWTPAKFELGNTEGLRIPLKQGNIARFGPNHRGEYYELWMNTPPTSIDMPSYLPQS